MSNIAFCKRAVILDVKKVPENNRILRKCLFEYDITMNEIILLNGPIDSSSQHFKAINGVSNFNEYPKILRLSLLF